jgi:hypothetical protein
MRARDRGEVLVAQLQLHGARIEPVLPQPPPHHDGELSQCGFERAGVCRIDIERVFVADRFRIAARTDFLVEPPSGVLAPGLSRQRQAPFAEAPLEEALLQSRQVADFPDTQRVEVRFGHLADSRDLADVERRQEARFSAREDPEHPVRFRLVRRHLSHHARSGDPDRTVQPRRRLYGLVQRVRGAERRPVQSPGACHIEIGLVDGSHLHLWGKTVEYLEHLARVFPVTLGVRVYENRLRAPLVRRAQRKRGVDPELPCRV